MSVPITPQAMQAACGVALNQAFAQVNSTSIPTGANGLGGLGGMNANSMLTSVSSQPTYTMPLNTHGSVAGTPNGEISFNSVSGEPMELMRINSKEVWVNPELEVDALAAKVLASMSEQFAIVVRVLRREERERCVNACREVSSNLAERSKFINAIVGLE